MTSYFKIKFNKSTFLNFRLVEYIIFTFWYFTSFEPTVKLFIKWKKNQIMTSFGTPTFFFVFKRKNLFVGTKINKTYSRLEL